MSTRELIQSLPAEAREKLEALKRNKNRFKETGYESAEKEYRDMIRGYVSCLVDMGIIKQAQFRQLYIYYGIM